MPEVRLMDEQEVTIVNSKQCLGGKRRGLGVNREVSFKKKKPEHALQADSLLPEPPGEPKMCTMSCPGVEPGIF